MSLSTGSGRIDFFRFHSSMRRRTSADDKISQISCHINWGWCDKSSLRELFVVRFGGRGNGGARAGETCRVMSIRWDRQRRMDLRRIFINKTTLTWIRGNASGVGNSRSFGLLNVFKCRMRFNPIFGRRGKMLLPKFLPKEKKEKKNERSKRETLRWDHTRNWVENDVLLLIVWKDKTTRATNPNPNAMANPFGKVVSVGHISARVAQNIELTNGIFSTQCVHRLYHWHY